MTALAAAIEARPMRAFLLFLVLHAVVWTLLPAAFYPNLPLDLIEALIYGREWQLGHDKLPPLPWWLVELAYRAIGRDWAFYALGQIAVCTAFAFVWMTARPLVGATRALVAVLILDGLHYFHYTAAKFNHDVVQLPLWALAGWAFHRGVRTGSLAAWAAFGAAIGTALWAKYFVVVLAAPLAVFLLVDPDGRAALRTPGPWIATVLALAIMAPHLYWLVTHDFLPFGYAAARAAESRGAIDHLWQPLKFLASQIGFLVPSLLITAALFAPRAVPPASVPTYDAADARIISWLAFGPVATLLLASALSGRGLVAMWGYPLWLFLGVWLVMRAGAVTRAALARSVALWLATFLAFAAAFAINAAVLPRFDDRYRAQVFPGEALAREVSARYASIAGAPPAYVVGAMFIGGNVSLYTPGRPRVLIDGKPERAPWIDLGDLRRRGAVVVWTDADTSRVPESLGPIAAQAQVQPPIALPFHVGPRVLQAGWAVLPPQPAGGAR